MTIPHANTPTWRSMASAFVLAVAGVLPPLLAGALAVSIERDLGINETTLGLAVTVHFLVSGGLATLGGRFADGAGWRRSARVASALSSCALLAIGLGARSVPTLALTLALAALAQTIAGPTTNLIIARELPAHRHGVILGALRSAIPVATMLAGLSVPAIALTVGWRWAFVLSSIFPVAALLLVGRGGARRSMFPAPERSDDGHQGAVSAPFVVMVAGAGLATTANLGLSTFLIASGVDLGISESRMGIVFAATSASGLLTRVTSGWLVDRGGSSGFVPTGLMLLAGGLGFALLATRQPGLLVPGALLAFGAGWGWSGLFHYGTILHHPLAPGHATGISLAGLASGAAVGPLLFGALAQRFGYGPAWAVAAVLVVVASGVILWGAQRMGPSPVPMRPRASEDGDRVRG